MEMRAAIIDAFGDERILRVGTVAAPSIGRDQVLIRIEYAGVGSWDAFEREGGYARMLGQTPTFPYILGSEGSGRVAAVGAEVSRFKVGDLVAAAGFLNPRGGFYAEYAAVDERFIVPVPASYGPREAGAVLGVGITALRGLADALSLRKGEKICILGASGGIGHLAVQMARGFGAEVCAVSSGEDGAALVASYGIDRQCDGHAENISALLDEMDFDGFDKALLLAGGPLGDEVSRRMKPAGIIAYPSGVFPEPIGRADIRKFDGDPDEDIIRRLCSTIEELEIAPHISREFPLDEAASAHRFIAGHHIGKAVLKIG